MSRFLCVLLLLLNTITLSSCKLMSELAPAKEDTTKIHDWMVVPVYYATTRKRAMSKTIDFLEVGADKGLMFGVKNMVVPAPTNISVSEETRKKMGWQLIHLDKALPQGKKPDAPDGDKCPVADSEYAAGEIASAFDKYRRDCGAKQAMIFVHGCCATFNTSLERAAKISSHLRMPVVVFDWDSPRGFSKYLANETTAEQSLDDFYCFLYKTESVIAPEDTIVLGHSMGARFVNDAFVRRSERLKCKEPVKKYAQIVFCQPDIDARSYIGHNHSITEQADLTRIYFNATDGRLDASATAHGGFERLGRPEKLIDQLCSVDNQEMIDVTEVALGHEIPFWVLADLTNHEDVANGGFVCKEEGAHHFVLHRLGSSLDSKASN